MREGVGYLTMAAFYPMFDIISKTVSSAGPEGFTSQALYETAQDYSLVIDGIELASYSDVKRDGVEAFKMYRASVEEEDLMPVDNQWIPVVREP